MHSLIISRGHYSLYCGSLGMVPLSPIFSYSVDPFSSPTFHAAATYKISWNNSDNYYNTSSSLNQSVVSFNYYNTSSSLNQSVVSFVVQVSYNELTTHYWLVSFIVLIHLFLLLYVCLWLNFPYLLTYLNLYLIVMTCVYTHYWSAPYFYESS